MIASIGYNSGNSDWEGFNVGDKSPKNNEKMKKKAAEKKAAVPKPATVPVSKTK